MKKVFIVHGFEGSPNGGWRPWLMGELGKRGIYACALSMPGPKKPVPAEWVAEIARHVERNSHDEIWLVGHSLGVPAIMRYAMTLPPGRKLAGAVLVSGPCESVGNAEIESFLNESFDFAAIRSKFNSIAVIHGDDDEVVPLTQAERLSKGLGAKLVVIKNGGHLNGEGGWFALPECLEELTLA